MIPSLESWKELSDTDRSAIIRDTEKFNPYSDEAYQLAREVGRDFSVQAGFEVLKIGVLNRFGELVVHAHVKPEQLAHAQANGATNHLGFRIFYSDINAWFEH